MDNKSILVFGLIVLVNKHRMTICVSNKLIFNYSVLGTRIFSILVAKYNSFGYNKIKIIYNGRNEG